MEWWLVVAVCLQMLTGVAQGVTVRLLGLALSDDFARLGQVAPL